MKPFLLLLGTLGSAPAAVFSVTDSAVTAIPDGHSSGLVRSLVVVAPGYRVTGAAVDLDLSAVLGASAFLGDLYFYLSNGTHRTVLVNRPGSRAGTPDGYGDNQRMNVTFSTSGTDDFHNYRLRVTGSHSTPLTSALTGIWHADGRDADPAAVLDTSPRTAGLDVFANDDASGTWSLFAADLSTGGVHQINSWTLRLTTIPEPGSAVLLVGSIGFAVRRRRGTPLHFRRLGNLR